MKKNIIVIILCFISVSAIAQAEFAIINDKDGFVNVHRTADMKSTIIGKLTTTSIFIPSEDESSKNSKWVKIYQQQNAGDVLIGYIYHDRYKLLSSFKKIGHTKQTPNIVTIKNDTIAVKITSAKFISKNHKLTYHKYEDPNAKGSYLQKIDGKIFWGTDGENPKTSVVDLKVTIKGKEVFIPKSAYSDLFEPRFSSAVVYLSPDNTIYIQLDNSDGAGAYSVIWIVKDGNYIRRYIENLEA